MTRAIALAIVLAAGVAHADREPLPLLGWRIEFGQLPLAGQRVEAWGLGIGVDHPVACKLRVFGEFEWLWLGSDHAGKLEGTGQRAHVGVRRALLETTVRRGVRFYLDGELGGGFALTDDNMTGAHAIPHALAGVRVGYDFLFVPKKTFEAEFLARALAVEHGVGAMFGVGLLWGG